MVAQLLPIRRVCEQLGLTETALRAILRRPGAPRPALHPTARVFLWTSEDVLALRRFLGRREAGEAGEVTENPSSGVDPR